MKTRLFIFLCLFGAATAAWGQDWQKTNNYFYFKGPMGGKSTLQLASITANGKVEKNDDNDVVIEKDANNKITFNITFKEVDILNAHDISAYILIDGKKNKATNINLKDKVLSYTLPHIYISDQNLHNVAIELIGNASGFSTQPIFREDSKFMTLSQQNSTPPQNQSNSETTQPKTELPTKLNPAEQSEKCKQDYKVFLEKVEKKRDLAIINAYIEATECQVCYKQCTSARKMKTEEENKIKNASSNTHNNTTVGGTSTCKTMEPIWKERSKGGQDEIKGFIDKWCQDKSSKDCPSCNDAISALNKLNGNATDLGPYFPPQTNPPSETKSGTTATNCNGDWKKTDKTDRKSIRAFRKKYCDKTNKCSECPEALKIETALIVNGSGGTPPPPPPPCQIEFTRDASNTKRFYLTNHKEIALDQAPFEVRDEKGGALTSHKIKIIPKGDAIYEIEGATGSETIKITTSDCGAITIKLDKPPFNANPILIGDTIKFNISNGTPPYRYMIEDNGLLIAVGEIKDGKLNIKQWLANREEASGTYLIQCKDANDEHGGGAVNYAYTEATKPMYFLWSALGVLLLAGLGYGAYWLMKKRRKEKVLAKVDSNQNKPTPDIVHADVSKTPAVISVSKKEGESTIVEKVVTPSKITITGKKSSATPLKQGEKLNYVRAEMNELWEDSAVSIVYISHKVIRDIYKFVGDETERSKEAGQEAAEVGGFLLGKISDYNTETASYEVSIDKFVATQAQDNNVYQMTFGLEAAKELDRIKEENTDMQTIGWFHTHPGHGLFLSQPDIRVHDSFFAEKHQIALEIDPLTSDFDAAIFTRKKDGEVNNQQDRKAGADWFKWVDWEKETRTK